MVGVLTWLGTYLALGVLSALVLGYVGWRTPHARKTLREDGYETLRREMRTYQFILLLGWPFFIPVLVVTYGAGLFTAIGNPHVRHLQSFQRQWAEYDKTHALEEELKIPDQDRTARLPEPFCPCLYDTRDGQGQEADWRDRHIQQGVQTARRYLQADHWDRDLLKHRVDENLKNVENMLKARRMWQ